MPSTKTPSVVWNGASIVEINPYETRFLYQEIFVDRTYLKNGIELRPGDIIFDVGANIGLFSMFCLQEVEDVSIFAFDPAPHCADCYRRNLASAGARVRHFEAALLDEAGPQSFTYYPHYSIMSGLRADPAIDIEILRSAAATQLGTRSDDPTISRELDFLVGTKLDDPVTFACEGLTLSSVIDQVGIERIDLLKIDVEKAEGMVLRGIENHHWPRIRQLVVEVHDLGNAEQMIMVSELRSRGFQVVLSVSDQMTASSIYNIYAKRIKHADSTDLT